MSFSPSKTGFINTQVGNNTKTKPIQTQSLGTKIPTLLEPVCCKKRQKIVPDQVLV